MDGVAQLKKKYLSIFGFVTIAIPKIVGDRLRVDYLFRGLKPGEMLSINEARFLGAYSVYLSGLRLSDGKF